MPLEPRPPKRTIVPVAGSCAITAPARADGLLAGDCWDQVLPSQVHVSERKPLAPSPPNRIILPLAGSYTIIAASRAGGLVAGDSCVQVMPFQVYVSERTPALSPPKSTSVPV